MASLVRGDAAATVAYANVHVLNESARDADLRDFLAAADIVYADGAGVVLGARLLGQPLGQRMTGADFIWDLAARAESEGWRIGWIGGEYGVTAQAARVLQERHPGLVIPLATHGYPRDAQDALFRTVRSARLDVLLVGMGTPAQERWVARHRGDLEVPVVWCIGATADFVSGRTSRGPRVLHQRQEWLARLLVEPRRLWRRYLVGNPKFLLRVLRARFG